MPIPEGQHPNRMAITFLRHGGSRVLHRRILYNIFIPPSDIALGYSRDEGLGLDEDPQPPAEQQWERRGAGDIPPQSVHEYNVSAPG